MKYLIKIFFIGPKLDGLKTVRYGDRPTLADLLTLWDLAAKRSGVDDPEAEFCLVGASLHGERALDGITWRGRKSGLAGFVEVIGEAPDAPKFAGFRLDDKLDAFIVRTCREMAEVAKRQARELGQVRDGDPSAYLFCG